MNRCTIAFVSLGCAKNLVNTEQMMALCRQAGYTLVSDPAQARVVVLNTCGFIESAKAEAIDAILELAALKGNGVTEKLLVTGCLPQRYREEILRELPEVDGILGTGSYTDIVSAVEAVLTGGHPEIFGDINRTAEDGARIRATPPWTAYLKIAEGCDNRCAYCVIPSIRGRYRSRPMESLLSEAADLAAHGVRELIVIAQDITRYGLDLYGKRCLADLLDGLCKLDFHWIRLHYLYPDEFDDRLIRTIAEQEKIVKYLDIPIQHINDGILQAMNRRGTGEELRELLRCLKERIPGLVLRTSLICGLPGEGEAEFEQLAEFLRGAGIQRAGIFPYSPEEGTPAAEMDGQVDPDTAAHRVELLEDVESRVIDAWNESRLGRVEEILCEGYDESEQCYTGRSYGDSPDIDGRVLFTAAGEIPAGTFVQVRLTGVSDGDMTGELEEW